MLISSYTVHHLWLVLIQQFPWLHSTIILAVTRVTCRAVGAEIMHVLVFCWPYMDELVMVVLYNERMTQDGWFSVYFGSPKSSGRDRSRCSFQRGAFRRSRTTEKWLVKSASMIKSLTTCNSPLGRFDRQRDGTMSIESRDDHWQRWKSQNVR